MIGIVITLRLESHESFPEILVAVGNFLIGTPCYLSCCGMRYSRIMRTWFLMFCYWRILFQKVKWIAKPLLCGKQCSTIAKYRLEKLSTYTTCHCVEYGQMLLPLLRNLSYSQDQDHVHATYICCSYTRSTQKHVFIHPKIFYSYIGNRHKNMLDRINALSSCKCLS